MRKQGGMKAKKVMCIKKKKKKLHNLVPNSSKAHNTVLITVIMFNLQPVPFINVVVRDSMQLLLSSPLSRVKGKDVCWGWLGGGCLGIGGLVGLGSSHCDKFHPCSRH